MDQVATNGRIAMFLDTITSFQATLITKIEEVKLDISLLHQELQVPRSHLAEKMHIN